jgi:hypothetical protein
LILPVCLMWRAVEERWGVAGGVGLVALYAAIGYPAWARIGAAMPLTVLSVPRLYVVIVLCAVSYWLLVTRRHDSQRRIWVGVFAVATGFSVVSGLRHQRGLYEEYARRLPVAEGALQMEGPVVQGGAVLSTAMVRDGYRTAVDGDEGAVGMDGGSVDELAVAANDGERWTERVGSGSSINSRIDSRIASSVAGRGEILGGEAPVASADGRWLAYLREERGRGGLWVRALGEGARADRMVSPVGWNVLEASFGADGSMVFSATEDGGRPGLFLVDAAGGIRALGEGEARYPAVSPDGRWMAYSRLERGNWHLWLLDLRGGVGSRLTEADCNNMEPTWTPDSKSLVYASDCGRALWFTMLSRRRVISQ